MAIHDACIEMDLVGLSLIAASLGLILLPLGLASKEPQGWRTPSMFGMIVVGLILFPLFLIYESKVPPKPVVPMRWLRRGPILYRFVLGPAKSPLNFRPRNRWL